MTDRKAQETLPRRSAANTILKRALSLLVVAAILAFTMTRITRAVNRVEGPAGFGRGVLQGALMPAAMPGLLLGRDIVIYAPDNTGRTYKLGYTVGVNACGAIFFGIFFTRLRRWRKREKAEASKH